MAQTMTIEQAQAYLRENTYGKLVYEYIVSTRTIQE